MRLLRTVAIDFCGELPDLHYFATAISLKKSGCRETSRNRF
jgi:hypothetical protein